MQGYLSYTLAGLAMLGAIAGYLMGSLDTATAMNMFWAGAVVFGIRRAIK